MSDDSPIRIFLSPPDVGPRERELLLDAFDSNWIAPLGPHVDAFEREMAGYLGGGHAVALSSGTAALHLALLDAGVGAGDEVLTSTLTFVATANAIAYTGASPVFVDVDADTWQMDPALVADAVRTRADVGRVPAAVVTVDLYGVCADHDPIRAVCEQHGIPLIEDAAEALGATYKGRPAGTLGDVGILSFNGNKIMTTSGGGMLVTGDEGTAERMRFLATQARDPAPHYQHSETGFNYRMSNLLAAVGRGQLESLDDKVARRRTINARYVAGLAGTSGITPLREAAHGTWNAWLTCVLVDPAGFGATTEDLRLLLRSAGIEARPVWKPLHIQPLFAGRDVVGGRVAEQLFEQGLCLPSGSGLADAEVDEIVTLITGAAR